MDFKLENVLKGIPTDQLLYEDFLDFDDRSSANTLGIRWNAHSDCFFFVPLCFQDKNCYTKREVLSLISKLFDPAGWLFPVDIRAIIIMQKIWIDGTSRDEIISPDYLQLWKMFQRDYPQIKYIRVPRWVDFSPESDVQFHAFCDASERAYGAALYIRIRNKNNISTHLISSKTKVAPVKTISIPRLELCGAVLLADMVDNLLTQLECERYTLYCWTDSMIVMSWLASPPCVWTTFMANRVARITQVTAISNWGHISSKDNPVDLLSRGVSPQELASNRLWWHGPEWLQHPPEEWPNSAVDLTLDVELEKKPVKVHFS
ncbi:uncharacterized protein LOC142231443 [Haematobia irritans]|uniref:uncharacterized protein LOC142231443 n=1 Tax=Haematobia irritans TaxID=7368 RepID=UPI003F4FCDE0